MARIRTVKPEFFQHEEIYAAEESSGLPLRLAYIGLWTQADRRGLFRWRPRELKLNILPYDPCDFSKVLDALVTAGFVKRYEANGRPYGAIPTFLSHQLPNVRERPAKDIPDPSYVGADTVQTPCRNGTDTVGVGRGRGRGRKGREGNGSDPAKREEADAAARLGVVETPPSPPRAGEAEPTPPTTVSTADFEAHRTRVVNALLGTQPGGAK